MPSPLKTRSETKFRLARPPAYLRKICFVTVAITLFIVVKSLLPLNHLPNGGDPQLIRNGLAILTLAAVLWISEALPLAVTALLIPMFSILTGTLDISQSFCGFIHPLIFLFLGGFGLAAALTYQGLDLMLATRVLKLGKNNFRSSVIILFTSSAVLSMWISNTATVAMLLPVALSILQPPSKESNYNSHKQATTYLLLGIAYSASVGGIATIIGSPPNAIAAANLELSFLEWLCIGLPCTFVLLPLLFTLLTIFLCPKHPPVLRKLPTVRKLNHKQIYTLIIFCLTIGCWLFSSQLAAYFQSNYSFDSVIAIIAVVILLACRLVSWKNIQNTTNWGVLLLFGGGITLSHILNHSGASGYLAHNIQHLSSGLPLPFFVGCIIVFVIFLTEVSSNTASAALLVPIFSAVALDVGVSPERMVIPLAFAASCAFMLPVATPPNAIVFSSGKVAQSDMIRTGLKLNLCFALALTLLSLIIL